ncbi:MAG: hypothetical protein WC657_07835 [Candidatus Paceibacterota bacterium]|jgi:hypothetical protein
MAQSGQTTVTTAGTEVQLNANQACNAVVVKALSTNTGIMYIGNDGANAVSSTTGFPLSKDDQILIETKNLNQWYVDASVNGEKVAWIILS